MFDSTLYIEIDIFAILVLLIIMDHRRHMIMSAAQRLFKLELISIVVVLVFDALTWGLNGKTFKGALQINTVLNYFYWFIDLLPCYICLLYCIVMIYGKLKPGVCAALAIPIFAAFPILIANIWTDWIFYVTAADNMYARGPYYLLIGGIAFVYMALGLIMTLGKYFRSPSYERRQYLVLVLFMAVPLIGAMLQIFIFGLQTLWIGLTIYALMCYVSMQNGSIATDPLTGLNNRGRFDSYSSYIWANLSYYSSVCLLILDIDDFKRINDTFGHAEGDRALVAASDALKKALAGNGGFLARIGGDEFAVLFTNTGCESAKRFIVHVNELLKASSEFGYTISMSGGYAVAGNDCLDSFRNLYSEADRNMYDNKISRRGSSGR